MNKFRNSLMTGLIIVLLAAMPYLLGASFGSGIKSIQQGYGVDSVAASTTDSNNVTITAVVLAKTEVRVWITGSYTTTSGVEIAPVLTTTTNLRLYMSHAMNATRDLTYTWQIIEYY